MRKRRTPEGRRATVDDVSKEAQRLLAAILALPGGKILTLVFGDEQMFKIDISEDGQLGYHLKGPLIFVA